MFVIIALFFTVAICLVILAVVPSSIERIQNWKEKKEEEVAQQLDSLFYNKNPKAIVRLYFILPPVLGLAGYILFNSILFVALGIVLGLILPNFILRIRETTRRQKFNKQLLDLIMLLSSCLKGGLSLLQALEVAQEEMPVPMKQEIGLVVRENKMGVPLEESLIRLNERLKMEALELIVNSLLVARETGGDLTKVLSRLSVTIRDNRKLKDSITTLTLQGRLQGLVMSALPFLFVGWVISFNKAHFDIMFRTDQGRMLLLIAIILQGVGMVLIRKFSTIKI